MRTRLNAARVNELVVIRRHYLWEARENGDELVAHTTDIGEQQNGMLEDGELNIDCEGYVDVNDDRNGL
jgi:hypothetical protein